MKAIVDTTVLTDALLKPDPQGNRARESLKRYSPTLLPTYGIKEFKAGPLHYYVWLHNKAVEASTYADVIDAITAVGRSVLAKSIRPSQASSGHWRFSPDLIRIWISTFNLRLSFGERTRFPNNRNPFVRPKENLLYLQHEPVRLDKSNRYRGRQLQGVAWRARGLEVNDRDTAER